MEELEKEAEEWVISNTEIYDDKFGIECEKEPRAKEAYIAGAKAHSVKWHDLRKNPDDLPKSTGDYVTNIGVLTYDFYGNGIYKWHTPFCEACDYSDVVDNDEVIAWCEIPKF